VHCCRWFKFKVFIRRFKVFIMSLAELAPKFAELVGPLMIGGDPTPRTAVASQKVDQLLQRLHAGIREFESDELLGLYGLDESATRDDVKTRRRKLALLVHPDKHPGGGVDDRITQLVIVRAACARSSPRRPSLRPPPARPLHPRCARAASLRRSAR
jgi:hypothetical protein